jgi:hypothetical protein
VLNALPDWIWRGVLLIKPSLALLKILDGGGCHGGDAIGGDALAEEVEAAVDWADGGFVGLLGEVGFAEGLVDDDDGAAELARRATLLKAFMPRARASEIQRVAGLIAGFVSLEMMD